MKSIRQTTKRGAPKKNSKDIKAKAQELHRHRLHTIGLYVPIALLFVLVLMGSSAQGITLYVSPSGDDSNTGRSSSLAFATIQRALDEADPGDTITLAPGVYRQSFETRRNGEQSRPITITGSKEAIVKGDTASRLCGVSCVARIIHDYTILDGFTIDGRHAATSYIRNLIQVRGVGGFGNSDPIDGNDGSEIRNMDIRNAWYTCTMFRWYVRDVQVVDNTIENCGQDPDSIVGEGIYLGTDAQTLNRYPGMGFDNGGNAYIARNVINVNGGSECIETKPRFQDSIIEYNDCQGVSEGHVGIRLKGGNNIVRHNTIHDLNGNQDVGISYGGTTYTNFDTGSGTVQVGLNNQLSDNTIGPGVDIGIDVRVLPQAGVCGTVFIGIDEEDELVPSHLNGAPGQAQIDAELGDPSKLCQEEEPDPDPDPDPDPVDSTPPIVELTTPANNTRLRGTINVRAEASDETMLDRVEFLVGGTLLATATEEPYAAQINTTSIPEGVTTVRAVAIDSTGNTATSSVAVTIDNVPEPGDPDPPPTPVDNDNNLAVNPSFETDPASDYFSVDNTVPSSFTWGTDASRSGNRSLRIWSRADGADYLDQRWLSNTNQMSATPGRSYLAEAWVRTQNLDGSAGPVKIRLNFWDAAENYIGGTSDSTTLSGTNDWTKLSVPLVTAPANTQYVRFELQMQGTGIVWLDDIQVCEQSCATIDSQLPSVNITTNSQRTNSSGLTINATASDNVGLDRVDFLVNGTAVHSDENAPFQFNWRFASETYQNGNYQVTAIAYDSSGNARTSQPVTIKVRNPDLSRDGIVNIFDLSRLLAHWNATNDPINDLNDNNRVDIIDLSILLAWWNR